MIKNLIQYYLKQKRHRGKTRLVKFILYLLPYRFIRSHYGVFLATNKKDITNIYAISGDYGYVIYNHIKSLSPDSYFIDIGANYGLFTNLAAQQLSNGQVFAFEPNPYIYRFFLYALEKNGHRNIIPFHCAVGPEDNLLSLSYNEKHSGLSSIQTHYNNDSKNITVPVFNIARLKGLDCLQDEKDIHIKIDVEGFEAVALQTILTSNWKKNIRSIVVEIDNSNLQSFGSSTSDLYNMMQHQGFKPTIGMNEDRHYDEIFIAA